MRISVVISTAPTAVSVVVISKAPTAVSVVVISKAPTAVSVVVISKAPDGRVGGAGHRVNDWSQPDAGLGPRAPRAWICASYFPGLVYARRCVRVCSGFGSPALASPSLAVRLARRRSAA
jgi:hypothetical protein